ncbi:hypothetical protein R6U77_02550 [Lysinibacillus louembei]|uniref:Uncharacterized protein n=1 Tax=Lysinibacillus louembei TaxID=1470088 RepID=A0ABZ0RZ74_9BACI|nr:hypothetical protein [Lysinibacillus louembei]WPK12596.1 hypothetical protein R6U77_02550 [Lysinibacillus louembei]
MTMYNTNSPITREERNNINATWQDILSRFAKIQSDIRFLTGNEEVEELIARINSSIDAANEAATNAENATLEAREATEAANNITTEARVLLGDLTVLQNVLEQMQTSLVEAKNNANEAATNANDATQLAQDATEAANTVTQESITATTNANEATQLAQESADSAAQATANAQAATEDANNAAQAANEKVTEATQLLTALKALKDELQQLQTDVTQIATAAETATINANQATENANTAITAANLATEAANTAATNASTATDTANVATIAATTAANEATSAASIAEQAATNATAATTAASEATTSANEAVTAANLAALSANIAATEANSAKDEVIVKIGEAIVATEDANNAAVRADLAADLIEGWEQKGGWNNTAEYVEHNLVTYNGSTWQAKRANTGVTPVSGDDWLLFAQRGVDGTGAVSSVNGVLPDEQGNVELDLQTGIKIETVSRVIYVGATREFTTIQSAIDSIGDIMSPQTSVVISVDQGVYDENIIIGRTQGGVLDIMCTSSRNRFTLNGCIDIRNTSSRVVLNNMTINFNNNNINKNEAIFIMNSTVVLNGSLIDSFNNNYGILTYSANVALTSVTINNSKYAISANTNSIINAYAVKGTGNITSYQAQTSSVINYAESNEIELTKETGYGGRIIPFNYNPVTTVNGQSPDASGNITIPILEVPTDYVKTINGISPDEDGDVEISAGGAIVEKYSRTIYVGATREFTTLQDAIDSIGDMIDSNVTIFIVLDAGTYTGNTINIGRTQGGAIELQLGGAVIKSSIYVRNTTTEVNIRGGSFLLENGIPTAVYSLNSRVRIMNTEIDCDNNSSSIALYAARKGSMDIAGVRINNGGTAIFANELSSIRATGIIGSNNTLAYRAFTGGSILYDPSNTITTTVLKQESTGGRVTSYVDKGVLTVNDISPDINGNVTIPSGGATVEKVNRTIQVGATRPIKTLQEAIDSIGDIIAPNVTIKIEFSSATYFDANTYIGRTQGGTIEINMFSAIFTGSISVTNTSTKVVFNQGTFTGRVGISVRNAYANLTSVQVNCGSVSNSVGISVSQNARVEVSNVKIDNATYAMYADRISSLYANNVSGAGNTNGYRASVGSTVLYNSANTLTATNLIQELTGGKVTSFS